VAYDTPSQYHSQYQQSQQYGHHQQADADRIKEVQEAQRIQQELLDTDKKAREIAERQRREQERAAADQANRLGWSSQRG
jgi:uncharacterized membrane protein YqiK